MVTVEAAACCVQQWQWVVLRKISVHFASTDAMSDVKENCGGRTDHVQQLRPQDADGTCQPANAFALETRVDRFFLSEHDQDLSDIRYRFRFRYGFRCSDANSDAGIARVAGGAGTAMRLLRRPLPGGGARKETCAKGGWGSKRRPRWGRRILYFDNLHARMRMHMHMFSHAHADPTWTPRAHPFSMVSTNTVDPIDPSTSMKPGLLFRSPCYCATSTLD